MNRNLKKIDKVIDDRPFGRSSYIRDMLQVGEILLKDGPYPRIYLAYTDGIMDFEDIDDSFGYKTTGIHTMSMDLHPKTYHPFIRYDRREHEYLYQSLGVVYPEEMWELFPMYRIFMQTHASGKCGVVYDTWEHIPKESFLLILEFCNDISRREVTRHREKLLMKTNANERSQAVK
jgi:hypothetical protein